VKKRVAILLAGVLLVPLGRGLFYHEGFYTPPSVEPEVLKEVVTPLAPSVESPEEYVAADGAKADEVSANYTEEEEKATVLVDLAHYNLVEFGELSVLSAELASEGVRLGFFEEDELEDRLEDATSFIVICPSRRFSDEELETVGEFVEHGGKLLLVGEPTRPSEIGRLGLRFGLVFEPGYLYNLEENEVNYRNIFVRAFAEHRLTEGIEEMVFYTAGSIGPATSGIAFADENTFSSVVETRMHLSPMAQSDDGSVFAIHDLTFMTEPHNGILDNGVLVSNIAGWLATAREVVEEEEPEEEEPEEEVEEEVEEEIEDEEADEVKDAGGENDGPEDQEDTLG
jgi:hypothetical protein